MFERDVLVSSEPPQHHPSGSWLALWLSSVYLCVVLCCPLLSARLCAVCAVDALCMHGCHRQRWAPLFFLTIHHCRSHNCWGKGECSVLCPHRHIMVRPECCFERKRAILLFPARRQHRVRVRVFRTCYECERDQVWLWFLCSGFAFFFLLLLCFKTGSHIAQDGFSYHCCD